MKRILNYEITKEYAGQPALFFLKQHGFSQQIVTHLKKTENGILLNGIWARVWDILKENDVLTLTITEIGSSENIVPVKLPFPIVYEDEDLLIINKPAGMPIHPSQGNFENTLANAAAYYFSSKNEPFIYRCINRLDKDTTGLLILARNMYSAARLSDMVAKREIHRTYLAIVSGHLENEGCIKAPIARTDGSTIERQVDFQRGEYACTHYRLLDTNERYSLAKLRLDTGRTHQIRVHMKYIGHPLPGDFLYNPDYSCISRQALHSYQLDFNHPVTGEKMCFTAPLPKDMDLGWKLKKEDSF